MRPPPPPPLKKPYQRPAVQSVKVFLPMFAGHSNPFFKRPPPPHR